MLSDEILKLKKQRGALILAHYYQTLDIQLVADFAGDSFDLSRKAQSAKEDVIVFCGVRFMAESAKLLSPSKTVLLPNERAGCPMADMVTPEIVRSLKREHPGAAVVCYVNSSAETKAECDICCTSSNAERVVRSLPNEEIIFVPDKNLGAFIASKVPEKRFIFMDGYCPIHRNITEKQALDALEAHPDALFAAHPECEPEVLRHAHYIGSTKNILDWCGQSDAKKFIIGTEIGVVERLTHFFPEKEFYLLNSKLICPNMKKTTLQDLHDALEYGRNIIELEPELIKRACVPLEKMMLV
ncbi:MAG: quinolinate synthase NadA [Eubacteriales bacterium]